MFGNFPDIWGIIGLLYVVSMIADHQAATLLPRQRCRLVSSKTDPRLDSGLRYLRVSKSHDDVTSQNDGYKLRSQPIVGV